MDNIFYYYIFDINDVYFTFIEHINKFNIAIFGCILININNKNYVIIFKGIMYIYAEIFFYLILH